MTGKIIMGISVFLVVPFLLICHVIGKKFLRNLNRKAPGEEFDADFDVSFYKNSPVRKMADEGMKYMETLPHEDVFINSHDGLRLHATYFPADENPKKFVVGIHGFQSHAWNEYAPHIAFYRSLGYSMILPDDRAHGYSEGRYITMGVKDRFDCVNWAKYIVDRFGNDVEILLHGVSMGGATVLSASAEKDLPKQVIGVISDCGFTCVEDAFAYQMKSMYHTSSKFPVKVCKWFAKHKAGFDFNDGRPIDRVKHSRVPILIVQGAVDPIVPPYMAKELYEACTSEKKLLMVEGASHAESIAIDEDGYHNAIHELFGI